MKVIKRILSIRKHKTIVFADVFDEQYNIAQLKISNEIFSDKSLFKGDVVCFEAEVTINNRGQKVYIVSEIYKVMKPKDNSNYKQMSNQNDIYKQALNGRDNLKHWEFKNILLEEINSYLLAKKFVRIITSNIMDKRGTSIVNPIKINGTYVNDKYLKITHELEIKKQVYLTLKSLFEIGYVSRDIYSTKKSFFEYLNLELVSIDTDEKKLISFYKFINDTAIKIAKELDIEYDPVFDDLKVIDVLTEYKKEHLIFEKQTYNDFYQKLKNDNPNCIFTNVVADNPFVKKGIDGLNLEIKWVINNSSVGHGYIDESDVDVIINSFKQQKEKLLEANIDSEIQDDFVQILMDAGIDTQSLNLGIDRFIMKFLKYKSIKKSYKILGV